jgi:hypothetical protein
MGGGLTTYNIVNLTGATSTITGNNTFARLALPPATTQTITFTDSSTQTASTFALSGSSGHVHTLQGSSTGGWNLVYAGSTYAPQWYISISRCTATPTNIFRAVTSTDGNNNVHWTFIAQRTLDLVAMGVI